MAGGGQRPGSGRPKGLANRKTREIAQRALTDKKTPLEVMLEIMEEAGDPVMKLDAAKAAAPYVHPKLSAVEMTGADGGPIELSLIDRLQAGIARAKGDKG